MKLNKIIGVCLLAGLCTTGAFSREVISFNDGWLFKKGPFATDMMKQLPSGKVSGQKLPFLIPGMRRICR